MVRSVRLQNVTAVSVVSAVLQRYRVKTTAWSGRMFTNVDVRGVARGRCSRDTCDCDGFSRSHTEVYVGESGLVQCGWCCYCGHSPVCHTRIGTNVLGQEEIVLVSWQAAPPPSLDQSACQGWDGDTLEPAQPVIDDDVILVESEDEKPALPDENQQLEQRKDVSFLEVSSLNADLLQQVEKLEQDNEQLKKHLADKKEISESLFNLLSKSVVLGKTLQQLLLERENRDENNPSNRDGTSVDDSELLPEQENSPRSISRKGHENILRKGPRKGPRKGLKKSLRRSPRSPKRSPSGICDDSSMSTEKLRLGSFDGCCATDRVCELNFQSLKRRRPNVRSIMVDIGNGVLVKEKQLSKLFNPHMSATKFGRCLLRTVFTPDELKGKCLMGRNKKGDKEPLDPIRVNAVIGYTCSKFPVNKHFLISSLSTMLYHLSPGKRPSSLTFR
ncbi:uncharacterized protein [Dermacentor andersoni]|uniref:uncharacterized protein isoform X1 n=1 Tax=Dermacentor andersoni TaxID=34620 RepID=UPI002417A1F9|nr:uncharacterized protein LOC129381969 isoform X1 [Dermacentor andersoni]